jgi:copper chaperone CopZ/cytochrome c biogenesis protein CcdA
MGDVSRVVFSVPDMHCEGCARSVREGLEQEPGATAVEVDIPGRRAVVEYDPEQTTPDTIRGHIREAGFEARSLDQGEPRPSEQRALGYALLALGIAALAVAGYTGYQLYPRFGLPAVDGAGLFLLAAAAGIASFFSPCAFPLLVTLLAREAGATSTPRRGLGRAVAFAAALSGGAAAFLLLAGLVVAAGGHALFAGFVFGSPQALILRAVVGALLILLGLVQLGVLPNPLHAVEALAKPLLRAQARERRRRATLGFGLFGFGYLLAGFG